MRVTFRIARWSFVKTMVAAGLLLWAGMMVFVLLGAWAERWKI